MNRLSALGLAAALAACGSDSKNDNPGGGGSTSVVVTGRNAFAATSAISFTASASCSGRSGSAVLIGISDLANACSVLQSRQQKQNAAGAFVAVSRLNFVGATAAPIGPGTYSVVNLSGGTPPQLDAQGSFAFVVAGTSRNDAACVSSDVEAKSGTVTITAVSASRVTGTVDLALDDTQGGGTVKGSFDAPTCALSGVDVCEDNPLPPTTGCVP